MILSDAYSTLNGGDNIPLKTGGAHHDVGYYLSTCIPISRYVSTFYWPFLFYLSILFFFFSHVFALLLSFIYPSLVSSLVGCLSQSR